LRGAWSGLRKEFPDAVVLVAAASLDDSRVECEEGARGARVLLDSEGETARRYNARWPARAYAWNALGVLTYVQPETTLDPDAPGEVAALWRQARESVPSAGAEVAAHQTATVLGRW
jgi:hypothetical protein